MQSRKDLDHFPNLSLERVEAGREAQQCASLLEFITQITCAHMMMITMTSMMMMIVIKNLDNNQHYWNPLPEAPEPLVPGNVITFITSNSNSPPYDPNYFISVLLFNNNMGLK